jgi:two-component system, sensor histidine kinase and response regulator
MTSAGEAPRANILLIDDEMPICLAVAGLLETIGFTASYALDGEEGMRFLENHPETDVVLLDINLGSGKSGMELLPEIRDRFKHVQVMMFTSHDSLSMGLECMKKGAADYLTKPFDEKDFLKKLPEVIAKKNMARLNELYFGILIHDLKSPLQSIVGAWELSKMYLSATLTETQQRVLSAGDAGIVQLRCMIDNMLSVAKLEAGTFPIAKEEFSVNRVADEVLAPVRLQIASSGRTIDAGFSPDREFLVVADRELFGRVLFNIIVNAIRYTPHGEKITAKFALRDDGEVRISIHNPGSYVDVNHREDIFDKFASVYLTRQGSGTGNYGLGLTFCKMAVEAMGGRIWVESEENTPSTTFHFAVKADGSSL